MKYLILWVVASYAVNTHHTQKIVYDEFGRGSLIFTLVSDTTAILPVRHHRYFSNSSDANRFYSKLKTAAKSNKYAWMKLNTGDTMGYGDNFIEHITFDSSTNSK